MIGSLTAKAYVKKWIRLNGSIMDISYKSDPVMWFRAWTVHLRFTSEEPLVALFFSRKWSGPLSALRSGDTITILGRIWYVAREHISLTRCQIIQIGTGEGAAQADNAEQASTS
jgi:hypothetical protein